MELVLLWYRKSVWKVGKNRMNVRELDYLFMAQQVVSLNRNFEQELCEINVQKMGRLVHQHISDP